jgi:hypothetical protein
MRQLIFIVFLTAGVSSVGTFLFIYSVARDTIIHIGNAECAQLQVALEGATTKTEIDMKNHHFLCNALTKDGVTLLFEFKY